MRTTLFYLHALGSSPRAFDAVAAHLPTEFAVVGVDLPGFGDAADDPGIATVDTVDRIVEVIRATAAPRWLLVGHSRGGRLASIVAGRVLRGEAPVFGLAGVVLLASSTPAPEPMDEDARARQLSWAGEGPLDAAKAEEFVAANVGAPLPPKLHAIAIDDLLRTSPEAWGAWLGRSSYEDWTDDIGVLDLPSLNVTGGLDANLGAQAQQSLNGPAYPHTDWVTLDGARHLLPLERPVEVAAAIAEFHERRIAHAPAVPAEYASLIAGDHVGARTRGILARRALPDPDPYEPQAVTPAQLHTLRALADVVVPQDGPRIDLAARVDAQLATGVGDGWRDASLPPDVDAYRQALDALSGFEESDAATRRDLVARLVEGTAELPGPLDAAQMQAWFADALVDLTRQWLAHPATMARIGFDGFATGRDGIRMQGFDLLAAGTAESWEPGGIGDARLARAGTPVALTKRPA